MIQIVKKKKPNSERIKTLREANNLSQEELLQKMEEDLGYTMSRRTYQRIEKGDDVQPKYLDYIIKFYDKKNIKLNIDELVIDTDQKRARVGKAAKSSPKKTIITYEYQKVYLYKVNHFEDISKLIAKSSRRKFFYPLTISNASVTKLTEGFVGVTEKGVIREIVSIIDKFGKENKNKNQIAREKYDSAELEFDLIDTVSNFGEYLKFMHYQGINLYASNFILPQLDIAPIDPSPFNDIYKYGVYDKVITILCFKRDKEQDLNFNYENFWHREKLEQLLKQYKMDNFERDVTDFSDPETDAELKGFEDRIKYFDGIDTSKVTFDHRVPFTNDDFEDPYEDFEPDGRDLAEMESQMEDEYKQQQRDKEDDPF